MIGGFNQGVVLTVRSSLASKTLAHDISDVAQSGAGEAHVVSKRAQRRLTAILAADVAGYSRLVGVDEEGTLAQAAEHA